MDPYKKAVVTVTQLNQFTKILLESNELLCDIFVRGELSNMKKYSSGHLYFSLKDEGATVAGAMWRSNVIKMPFEPKDGMRVIAHGRVTLYEDSGRYQIIVDDIQPDGVGSLYYAYEQLKAKLGAEGLFDEKYKKKLPRFPRKVGIITSPTGAAVRDMMRILGRRYPLAEILLYPSLVQGSGAPAQLVSGIEYFCGRDDIDVIIIGRGGGSIEDLWAFNDERLARAVFSSDVPIISAVGHESDFTICDFVADLRASTPSAAAELAVPEQTELKAAIEGMSKRLSQLLSSKIAERKRHLSLLSSSGALRSPMSFIDNKRMKAAQLGERLDRSVQVNIEKKKALFGERIALLEAMNPLAVLSRGYGVVYTEDGRILKTVKEIKKGDLIKAMLGDGAALARVEEITEKEKDNGKEK